ncbi:lytic transglycosylase domain-containing protein [Mycetocola tolaasinivorans]|uniref:Lytic transglycosylase domain-containing protein n=1 Tax=Mycetocola tolaasinivorans TaxID=76635 RepID=A0A3L7A572_9MICO|nr:lytic transglycosylase domain-containing protein [Mycetocola tolaasinivorans]
MTKHLAPVTTASARRARRTAPVRPFSRGRFLLGCVAFAASAGFVLTTVIDPSGGAVASPYHTSPFAPVSADVLTSATQALEATGEYTNDFSRDGFDVALTPKIEVPVAPPATDTSDTTKSTKGTKTTGNSGGGSPSAPPAAPPNAGSAQAIAFDIVMSRGWGQDQYACLVALWNKESGWRYNAANPSGAYGIPQALPGRKMASAGADWQTNPATQIQWGLGYITGRYGSPCGAWAHSQAFNWY